jgi:hypothetical protein
MAVPSRLSNAEVILYNILQVTMARPDFMRGSDRRRTGNQPETTGNDD